MMASNASSPLPMRRSALVYAGGFFVVHALLVLGLCSLAALGRVFQVGWQGHMATAWYVLLEVIVEGARVALVLAAIGEGRPGRGWRTIRGLFGMPKAQVSAGFSRMGRNIKARWALLLVDVLLFALVAVAVNTLIGWIAGRPSVHTFLIGLGVANTDPDSLGTIATLFLKNYTVIPLTLVFQYGLVRQLLDLDLKASPSRALTGSPRGL